MNDNKQETPDRELYAYKADGLTRDSMPVESITLRIELGIPENYTAWEKPKDGEEAWETKHRASEAFHTANADRVLRALRVLPAGTRTAVLSGMLRELSDFLRHGRVVEDAAIPIVTDETGRVIR